MALEIAQYPRLANLTDLPRLISGDGIFFSWPPPGTTVTMWSFPELWPLVTGHPTVGEVGDWYVTDLATLIGYFPADAEQLLARFSALWLGPLPGYGVALGQAPVIFEVGKRNIMRWIRTTLRGDLASGIEQFQHKLDLGFPGDDPDISSATAATLATSLAGWWQSAFSSSLNGWCAPDVRYLEVGVTQCVQTDPTDADGTGGNFEQSFETEWHLYPSGSRPAGSSGTTLPYEVSCAVTLQTDVRGARGRGRFYLPPASTGAMTTGGLWIAGYTTAVNACITAYLNSIVAGTPYVPVVVSRRGIILNEVTEVNVGRVPDAQRRRRWSQAEARIVGYTA